MGKYVYICGGICVDGPPGLNAKAPSIELVTNVADSWVPRALPTGGGTCEL